VKDFRKISFPIFFYLRPEGKIKYFTKQENFQKNEAILFQKFNRAAEKMKKNASSLLVNLS